MKTKFKNDVLKRMGKTLNNAQLEELKNTLDFCLFDYTLSVRNFNNREEKEVDYKKLFLAAKKTEGRAESTLRFYRSTIDLVIGWIKKEVTEITTEDMRIFLAEYETARKPSKVTLDNIRRIMTSYFQWLEDEEYILKSPLRRIKPIKTPKLLKQAFTDEELEKLRHSCTNKRDLALVNLLSTTGIRVGEIVKLDRKDIDFKEREFIVFGKGSKERYAYFDARTKLYLMDYLESRKDDNEALFVSLKSPYERLSKGAVEIIVRKIGKKAGVENAHPHRFRRTLATDAIDKGMPIEQVQSLLGHDSINTTLMYAMVKQSNVKASHKKFIG